jgi:hypothetical protein
MTVLIGADPELFAFKGNKPISVHNLLTGDKKNPLPVEEGAVQVDGTAAEFNIIPTDSEKVFVERIAKVRNNIESIIQKVDKKVVLRSTPAVRFDKDYWETIPSVNKELGCDPDFNAYTGGENEIVPEENRVGFETMRTGSGHIHIGWRDPKVPLETEDQQKEHFINCRVLTMILDNVILPFERYWDKDTERRKLYGKPGAFRPKPYGCEYRVLSNAWVDKPEVASLLFRTITDVVNELKKGDIKIYEKLTGSLDISGSQLLTTWPNFYSYIGKYDPYLVRSKTPINRLIRFFEYGEKV